LRVRQWSGWEGAISFVVDFHDLEKSDPGDEFICHHMDFPTPHEAWNDNRVLLQYLKSVMESSLYSFEFP
jgi:hypothetical protein